MFKRLSALLMIVLAASLAYAAPDTDMSATGDDSSDSMGYDAIINQLNREQASRAATSRAHENAKNDENPLDSVWMHGGVGFANFIETVHFDDGASATLNQKGIQAALGIDLFSPNWMAEGTARSFAEDGDAKVRSSVHEFELKVLYKDRINNRLGFRTGLGITGRYLGIKRQGLPDANYTTPTSVATLGGDMFINDRLSVGADVNGRNSLIGETIDHNSFDLTVRVDAHF